MTGSAVYPGPVTRAATRLPGGLFLSFEGGDGAGKSTQLTHLADWLEQEHGLEVVRTREPGGTDLGRTLRTLVLHGDDVDARTEALLYATDRAHHVATLVRPALERGAVVLTDRYLDSSLAYQAGGRELGMAEGDIGRVVDLAVASPYANPRPVDAGDVEALLRAAWAGLVP